MNKLVRLTATVTVLLLVIAADANAQEEAAAPELTTRFYDVSQLIVAKPQYPFTGKLPASSGNTARSPAYDGGLGGGGGGFGGGGGLGGGGGGGMFSVPPTMIQFGAGGGFDLGVSNPAAQAESMFIAEYSADGIAELVTMNVDPDSWEGLGGGASVTALGNTLLILQTDPNHAKIGDFLRQLTAAVVGIEVYEVEAWWIPATASERRELNDILRLATEQPKWSAALDGLSEDTGGFHGRLLCRERVTVHLASGERRPLVVGSVPVVGGNSSLAQPIVNQMNIGLTMEVTVIPVADYLSNTQPGDAAVDEVFLNLRSAITSLNGSGNVASRPGDIDRFDIGANVLESGTRLAVGKPTLVGSLTSVGIRALEGEDENETSMVVVITRR
jgi:hypothetical protein